MSRLTLSFLCLWLICGLVLAYPPRRKPNQGHNIRFSGQWDFLTFSQIWPPTFCTFDQCDLPENDTTWNIHGLWPSVFTGKDPEFCKDSTDFDINALKPIYTDLVNQWRDLKNYDNPKEFWSHEWNAHGRCAVTDDKLIDQLTYFNATLLVKEAIQLNQRLSDYGILPKKGEYISASDLLNGIRTIYRTNGEITCMKHHSGDFYLYEVRLCLDQNLILIDCPKKSHVDFQSKIQRLHYQPENRSLKASSVTCGDRFLYQPPEDNVRV